MSEISNQVEALLFSSGRAMNVEDISVLINLEKKEVKKALKELKEKYVSFEGSIMVSEEGDSWKLNIKERYASLVMKIIADTEMSKTVLETLSVIAWKSPVLQSEVIKIRTSNAYEHIKELVDAGFINKEREGRSYMLRIAEKFFEYFDVPGDKGIKEAFKEVKIPEKQQPQHLGNLEVVSVEENSSEEKAKELQNMKDNIPPIDREFLSKVGDQITSISAKNDELEQDDLFKRKSDDETNEETSEISETNEDEESEENDKEKNIEENELTAEPEGLVDEYVEGPIKTSDESQEESPEVAEEDFVEKELSEEKEELGNKDLEILEESLEEELKEEKSDDLDVDFEEDTESKDSEVEEAQQAEEEPKEKKK